MMHEPNVNNIIQKLLTHVGQATDSAQHFYYANCDEAWEQVKGTFRHPKRWMLGTLGALMVVILCAALFALSTVHAPKLPSHDTSKTPDEMSTDIDSLDDLEAPLSSGERSEQVYTFLLLGTDSDGYNTDTIMLVSYDIPNQDLSLMSIPRDTMVNLPWDIKKINSVYGVYGIEGLKEQVGKLVGFTPDYYIKINVHAFVKVIDLLDGVWFDVPRNMDYDDPYQNLHIHLKKGYQHLDGTQAMGLVRWRHNNDYTLGYSDEQRMQTQQAFLKAAAEQCLTLKNWTKVKGLIDLFYTYVESDLTMGEMLWFAKQGMGLTSADDIRTFTMPGNYEAYAYSYTISKAYGYDNYQSYVTVDAKGLLEIVNQYFNPYASDITVSRLDIMTINADGSVTSSTGNTLDKRAAQPPELIGRKRGETGDETTQNNQSSGSVEASSGSLTLIDGITTDNE